MKTTIIIFLIFLCPLVARAFDLTIAETEAIVEFFKLDASKHTSIMYYPDDSDKWFIRINGCKLSDQVDFYQSGNDLPAMVKEMKRIYLDINP